jgi:hypothetical protein
MGGGGAWGLGWGVGVSKRWRKMNDGEREKAEEGLAYTCASRFQACVHAWRQRGACARACVRVCGCECVPARVLAQIKEMENSKSPPIC